MSERIHASCIAIDGRAVLLLGPSGAGKSDLALRLIDEGARLVSDDYTDLAMRGGALLANAPNTIWGQIEVRGLGIMRMTPLDDVPVSLAVVLERSPDRLPEPRSGTWTGVTVPLVNIDPRVPSAPARVRLALENIGLPAQ